MFTIYDSKGNFIRFPKTSPVFISTGQTELFGSAWAIEVVVPNMPSCNLGNFTSKKNADIEIANIRQNLCMGKPEYQVRDESNTVMDIINDAPPILETPAQQNKAAPTGNSKPQNTQNGFKKPQKSWGRK